MFPTVRVWLLESDHLLMWLVWLVNLRQSASEPGQRGQLRLWRGVVRRVVAAGCNQAKQGGRCIAAFGDIPADGLYGVAADFTAHLRCGVRQNGAQS